jgi:hypothetical protein
LRSLNSYLHPAPPPKVELSTRSVDEYVVMPPLMFQSIALRRPDWKVPPTRASARVSVLRSTKLTGSSGRKARTPCRSVRLPAASTLKLEFPEKVLPNPTCAAWPK